MHFCDEAIISAKAGRGGSGSVSFRREKYIPKGGPDGGNGGEGGHIIFRADFNLNTLVNFMSQKHFKAKSGESGRGRNQYGKKGEDLILKTPVGTFIYDSSTGALLKDLAIPGEEFVAARGGRGGKGNANFKSSVRQTPDFAELGEPGEEKQLRLELKLIADVAIIGFPSVGKSTLIARVSNARPKIADYPFTTLVPNLGVVKVDDTDFVMVDIPGLIEGAHEGKGLGHAFLRHIERARFLIHLLDLTHEDLKADYKTINDELKRFSPTLAKKPQLLALNKMDAAPPAIIEKAKKAFKTKKPLFISAVSGKGIQELLYRLKDEVKKLRSGKKPTVPQIKEENFKIFRPHLEHPDARQFEVTREGDGFRVKGKRIEQIAVMTDKSKKGGIMRLHDVLKKIGAQRELVRLGAQEGDKIFIGPNEFEFIILD